MAHVVDSFRIDGMRLTHFEQLMTYLIDFEREGCYYGNKEQFFKRHEELKKWLSDNLELISQSDARIPKAKI